jgi:transposase-like protein
MLAFIVKHRYACTRCGRCFRDDRGATFAELSAAVSLASDSPSAR